MAALILIAANILSRPVARRIYPLVNFSETDNRYTVSVVCDERYEGRLRSYLINAVRNRKMYLVSLDSNDLPGGRIEIIVEYTCFYRNPIPVIEQITTSCLKNEDKVSAKWEQVQ